VASRIIQGLTEFADALESRQPLDRRAFSVVSLARTGDDRAYWAKQTPQARLRAMELLRRINYGHAAAGRLQRILEVVQQQTR
jgi:hypothetical protein